MIVTSLLPLDPPEPDGIGNRPPTPSDIDEFDAFLCYARDDSETADRLVEALEAGGKRVWRDDRIPARVEWKEWIADWIAACPAFLLLLSPNSVASEHCREEWEMALAMKKNVVTARCEVMDDRAIPSAFGGPEFVDLAPGREFGDGVKRITTALETNIDWWKPHARYELAARHWLASGQSKDDLLHGASLRKAKDWLLLQTKGHEATIEERQFLDASERAVNRRLRLGSGMVAAVAMVALGLMTWALLEGGRAVRAQKTAESQDMAAQASGLLMTDGPQGILLSIEAYRRAPTRAAGNALLAAASLPLTVGFSEDDQVDSVAFDRTGQLLAVGDADGHVDLRNAASGQPVARLNEVAGVNAVAFSPVHDLLAVGDQQGRVGLWSTTSRQRIRSLPVGGSVDALAFILRGRVLVAGSTDGRVSLWNVGDGHQLGGFARESPVVSAAVSPNGRTLIVGYYNGTIIVWDLTTGKRAATLRDGSVVLSVAFSPDGKSFASGDLNGDVDIWSLTSRAPTVRLHDGIEVDDVDFSPDGQLLAVGDETGRVGLWDLRTQTRVATLPQGNTVYGLAFSPSGRTLAVGDLAGNVDMWSMAGTSRFALLPAGSTASGVAFQSGRPVVAVGYTDGSIGIWNLDTGTQIRSLSATSAVNSVAFSPTGGVLATGDFAGNVELWSARTWNLVKTIDAGQGQPGASVNAIAFSRDGSILAIGDEDAFVELRDARSSKLLHQLNEDGSVYAIAFDPTRPYLAVGDQNGNVELWDIASGKKLHTYAGTSPVQTVAFSTDGRVLAAGDKSGDVRIWRGLASRPQTLREGSAVDSLSVGSDDSRLAVGDESGDVTLWNLQSDTRVQTFSYSSGEQVESVNSVAFSPSGLSLVAGDNDGNVEVLHHPLLRPNYQALITTLCREVRTNLTRDTWDADVPATSYHKTCLA